MKRVAGYVKAVDGVSLAIQQGKTLALVGESGCGKTTVGKGILQLIPPSAAACVTMDSNWSGWIATELRKMRAEFQLIFQDPYSSLNPRMRIVDIIEEGMNALGSKATVKRTIRRIISRVPKGRKSMPCWKVSGCRRKQNGVIHMNFPAVSASVSPSPVLWRSAPG